MNIGNKGLELIKSFEGCRLEAYRCSSNVLTIGWGHTKGVYEGMKISQAEADRMLLEDIQYYADAVERYNSKFNFTQDEFDALTSFTYNCGVGSLQAVMSCCNTKQEIAEECKLYNKSGGVVLAGLVRRREAEYNLFMSGSSPSTPNSNSGGEVFEKSYPEKGIATVIVDKLNVRNVPSTENNEPVATYEKGEEINYDSVYVTNKYYYISYVSESGIRRYVASRSRAGKQYLNCR